MKQTKPPAEPVNGEQLDASTQTQASLLNAGPTPGELEERTVTAEDRAAAAERENAELKATIARMDRALHALQRQSRETDPASDQEPLPGEGPVFDEQAPHGIVYGDPAIAYVQNGFMFARDKSFVARDPNRGVGRAFNPRLVGKVKPRPGVEASGSDPLDGFRPAA